LQFSSLDNTSFIDNQANTFNVTVSGSPTGFSLTGSPPAWLSLDNAGHLTGSPPAGIVQTQSFTFTVNATDGTNSIQQPFTLYVVPKATAPAPIQAGDLLVYRVGDGGTTYGSTGTGGSASGAAAGIFIDEYHPNGTFVQTIFVPTQIAGGNVATAASISASS